jgi:hypothetical protein
LGFRIQELQYATAASASTWQFKASDLIEMKADFQRPINRGTVAKIVKEWDIRLFEQPTVFILPDDTCVLGEGQHRVRAFAEKVGPNELVTSRVVPTDRPGALFVAISQSKRRVEQIHVFNAAVADGEPNVVGAKAMAEKYGFNVSNHGGPRGISAVVALLNAHATDPGATDKTLYALSKIITTRGDELGWTKANVIRAMWYTIRNYDVNVDKLVRKVSKRNPDAAVPYTVNDARRNVAEIVALYNSGLREAGRIDVSQPKYTERGRLR